MIKALGVPRSRLPSEAAHAYASLGVMSKDDLPSGDRSADAAIDRKRYEQFDLCLEPFARQFTLSAAVAPMTLTISFTEKGLVM
jgi:hypothetical protein